METLTLSELKGLCAARKLPVSGNKTELIERLTKGAVSTASARTSTATAPTTAAPTSSVPIPSANSASSAVSALFPSDYEALTIAQLKDLCRERLQPVGGIKDDLVARLNASDPRKMTLQQLKDQCRDANLPVTGTKSDLAERVIKNMTSGTTALLQTKSVDELKELCRESGLPVGGKKDELIARIKLAGSNQSKQPASTQAKPSDSVKASSTPAAASTATAVAKKKAPFIPAYESLTVPQLKDICRGKGMAVGGTKDELVQRLIEAAKSSASASSSSTKKSTTTSSDSTTTYATMTIPQLKDLCRDRTLPVGGTKEELLARLEDHDKMVRAMFKERKSSSNSSLTSASGGKRKASPAESSGSSKKQKTDGLQRARKSTGGSAGLGRPPLESFAARKSAPKQQPSKSGKYIVYSTCAYPADGFHSYAGPGEPTFYESYDSVDKANARVEQIFYGKNPWGLSREEMDDKDYSERYDPRNNLLRLEVTPDASEEWVVTARELGTSPHQEEDDGDVSMVSASDTEDEQYAYRSPYNVKFESGYYS